MDLIVDICRCSCEDPYEEEQKLTLRRTTVIEFGFFTQTFARSSRLSSISLRLFLIDRSIDPADLERHVSPHVD
jgi:hypothetical protein